MNGKMGGAWRCGGGDLVMSPLAGVGERSRDDPKQKYLI